MNAPTKAVELKAAIVAAATFLAAMLGWRGVIVALWCAAMLLDYISGTCAAIAAHEWSSAVARKGIWHKAGSISIVLVAAMLDVAIHAIASGGVLGHDWSVGAIFLPLVAAWCLMTELGSVAENAVKLGAPCPPFLTVAIKALRAKITDKAERKDEEAEGDSPPEDGDAG